MRVRSSTLAEPPNLPLPLRQTCFRPSSTLLRLHQSREFRRSVEAKSVCRLCSRYLGGVGLSAVVSTPLKRTFKPFRIKCRQHC